MSAYVDTPGAARHLGLAVATLNQWRSQGRGPRYSKAGRSVRYAVADLDRWMAEQRVEPKYDRAPPRKRGQRTASNARVDASARSAS